MPHLTHLACAVVGLASATAACDRPARETDGRGSAGRDGAPQVAAGSAGGSLTTPGERAAQSTPLPELRIGDRRIAIAAAPAGGGHAVVLTVGSGARVARARLPPATASAWVRRARDLISRPPASRRPAARITEEAPLRGEAGGVVLTLARTVGPGGRPSYRVQAAATSDRAGPGAVVIPDLSASRAEAFVDAVARAAVPTPAAAARRP